MLRRATASFVQFALTMLVASLVALAAASATTYAARSIDIGDARSLPLGRTVTLKGTVTSPSGAFQSGIFDEGFLFRIKPAAST